MLLGILFLTASIPSANGGLWEGIYPLVLELLSNSPEALWTVCLALFSGHIWTYIILCYFSKRESKILKSKLFNIAFGLLWFACVFFILYFIRYKNIDITLSSLLDNLVSTLVISLFLQFIIFVAFISIGKVKGK